MATENDEFLIEEDEWLIEEEDELKTYTYVNNGFYFENFVGYEVESL